MQHSVAWRPEPSCVMSLVQECKMKKDLDVTNFVCAVRRLPVSDDHGCVGCCFHVEGLPCQAPDFAAVLCGSGQGHFIFERVTPDAEAAKLWRGV